MRQTIRDHMTPNPVVVGPATSVSECARILHKHRIRHLPVVTDTGSLFGLLTDFDVFLRGEMADDETFVTFDGTATWMQAHHLCRRVERPVGPNDDLLSGLERLLGTRQDILVVVDQDRVVGVLCEHDVVGLAANMEGPLSFRQRNVGHVLRTVDQHDPARRARYVMANERIRHIVVLEEKRLHSVLSFRDVALEGTLSERRGAGSVGPGRAEFALVGVGVAEAARRMVAKKFGCLPLVDSLGIPVDIVTRTDVIRAVVDALAKT